MSYGIEDFLADCRQEISQHNSAADHVEVITPLMYKLIASGTDFLEEKHFQSHPEHYSRNAVYIDPNNTLSLFALVWLPGQWTPIHDHGTWGVVGVIEGGLEERNFIRTDKEAKEAMENIELSRGGSIILSPGSVTSFVPNPDHIHKTGNAGQKPAVSLHLYGHAMSGFNIYDRPNGKREWTEVSHD